MSKMQEWTGTDTPGQSLFKDSIHINSEALGQEEDEEQQDQKRRENELGSLMVKEFDNLELDDEYDDDDDEDDDDNDTNSVASNNLTDINLNNNSIISGSQCVNDKSIFSKYIYPLKTSNGNNLFKNPAYNLSDVKSDNDESDSIKQLKLGNINVNSNGTNSNSDGSWRDDLTRLDLKQKRILELENIISEKDDELNKCYKNIESFKNETTSYVQHINQLQREVNQQTLNADKQIKYLSQLKEENENLLSEKNELEETLAKHEQTIQQLHQETLNSSKKHTEKYLEMQERVVDKVKKDAELEMYGIVLQLEDTQKELSQVKQLYIDVCGTKEKLIKEHEKEIDLLKSNYANIETLKNEFERLKTEHNFQLMNNQKLTNDCEEQKKKILELEAKLEYERDEKLQPDYIEKINNEIKRAKEEALNELQQAYPEKQISILLPNDCQQHSYKISQLENECKYLKDKLSVANDELTKIADVQLKIAQMEIKNDKLSKISKKYQSENEVLKNKYDDCQKKSIEYNEELNKYKELVVQLTRKNEKTSGDLFYEERIKQLEIELNNKNLQIKKLEELKSEKDQLVNKFKNQAKKLTGELNLSPRATLEDFDFQKIYEYVTKNVREEMLQKVASELKLIEDNHRTKENSIEDKYKNIVAELKSRYTEKTKEFNEFKDAMLNENRKLQASFNDQKQIVTQIMQELFAKNLIIEELQQQIQQKDNHLEEEKNAMAGLMSDWAKEMEFMKVREVKMQQEINQLQTVEKKMKEDFDQLKKKEKQLKSHLDFLKHKYNSAKSTAQNYKECGEKKEKFLIGECKRIEEGYKKAMNQVQQNVEEIVNTQKKVEVKVKELENQYERKLQLVQQQIKYKENFK